MIWKWIMLFDNLEHPIALSLILIGTSRKSNNPFYISLVKAVEAPKNAVSEQILALNIVNFLKIL